jgi:hypothetical protein
MRLLWAVPLILALASCTGGSAVTRSAARVAASGEVTVQGITVSGLGRVTGKPDVLRVTVGVSVTAETVQAALDAANTAADALMGALREKGVAEGDTRTRDFSVSPEFRYPQGGAPVISGYTVRNTVEAKIRDITRAGEVLTAVVQAGGNAARIEGVGFALEDNVTLLEQARKAAFEDARAKATQYARLADRPLGALLSVTEASTTLPSPVPVDERAAGAQNPSAPVPIAPGEQEVSISLTAVWALG